MAPPHPNFTPPHNSIFRASSLARLAISESWIWLRGLISVREVEEFLRLITYWLQPQTSTCTCIHIHVCVLTHMQNYHTPAHHKHTHTHKLGAGGRSLDHLSLCLKGTVQTLSPLFPSCEASSLSLPHKLPRQNQRMRKGSLSREACRQGTHHKENNLSKKSCH